MNNSLLFQIGEHCPKMQNVVMSALEGDFTSAAALFDFALEEGLKMQSIEVGLCYMVKTHTHYYLGKVIAVNFAEIVLTEAFEVYDTGSLEECYGQGKIKSYEAFPKDAKVSIPVGSINGTISWTNKLPSRRPS